MIRRESVKITCQSDPVFAQYEALLFYCFLAVKDERLINLYKRAESGLDES
jgi:hypothetical protein